MSQRDDYLTALERMVGRRYCNDGRRCGGVCFDCSSYAGHYGLNAVGIPYPCNDTSGMERDLVAGRLTVDRLTARVTAGCWAIRPKGNPAFADDGHVVVSRGDGTTYEAHSHADGVIVGTFDGDRGFTVFGFPPGLTGFTGADPVAPVVVPPRRTIILPGEPTMQQTDLSVKLDGQGNGYTDLVGHRAAVVHSLTAIGTVDPSLAHHYAPSPRVSLTISPAQWARVVFEDGVPHGAATARILHD